MKKILAALALVAIVLTGCASGSQPEAAASRAEVDSTPGVSQAVAETAFLTTLRAEYPEWFVPVPDRMLLGNAQAMCVLLDEGSNPYSVLTMIADAYDGNYRLAGYFYGSSTAAFCPVHNGSLG